MKVSKWVDMGQEVEMEVGVIDVRTAMREAFAHATADSLDDRPTAGDIKDALNDVAIFLKALSDEQIVLLGTPVRTVVKRFLEEQAVRFSDKLPEPPK